MGFPKWSPRALNPQNNEKWESVWSDICRFWHRVTMCGCAVLHAGASPTLPPSHTVRWPQTGSRVPVGRRGLQQRAEGRTGQAWGCKVTSSCRCVKVTGITKAVRLAVRQGPSGVSSGAGCALCLRRSPACWTHPQPWPDWDVTGWRDEAWFQSHGSQGSGWWAGGGSAPLPGVRAAASLPEGLSSSATWWARAAERAGGSVPGWGSAPAALCSPGAPLP